MRLKGTAITDEGFHTYLESMPALKELDLRGTGVKPSTVRGVADFGRGTKRPEINAKWSELMQLRLNEDNLDDPASVEFLALASELSYLQEKEGVAAFRDQLGLDARLFVHANIQAYVATRDDAVMVVFRGTENPGTIDGLKDWLVTDALNLLVLPEGRLGTDFAAAGIGAQFHQGFLDALTGIWDPVFDAVRAAIDEADRPLWLTGHSLGGALAQLAGWLFTRRFMTVQAIVTFGGPMVGNDLAMKAFDRELGGKIIRYVDPDDPIPLLPSFSLIANAYRHCQREVRLGSAATAVDVFQNLSRQGLDGLLKGRLVDAVWGEVVRRVACHMMPNYIQGIARTIA